MSEAFVPGVGAVFSADIAVPEHERELRFYSRVLSTGENPLWRENDLMNNLGMPVIDLGARTAEYAHLPLQWMPHIQVANVSTSVRRALDLGGSVLMHANHEDGTSQWAVLLDRMRRRSASSRSFLRRRFLQVTALHRPARRHLWGASPGST